ncbi:hypothetical protein JG688_00016402 [Phytophthora aleatoria]|uniref:Protein kinase domain-containing protein n=1 Tax=Phytophthora aleatoria TaxID=2496075 RepID=A0A8J5IIZ2_9STRA|nr:hypothetical protein JG688_00016402 [Phytophthora aleatoria]
MTSNIVSIMNRHTGMVLEQNLLNNSVQAFDSGLDEPTHQWYRIPVGGGYFVYKNVATGNVLDHWDIKEGAGNTVAMSDDVKDPKRQWFEVKLGDVFIGLRNRASRLFIDHYASREIRTSGEDSTNIVPFYGANFTTEPFFIVSEFAENGTLNDYLAKGNVGLKAKWQLMHQVAVGLSYLHRKNIIHGDLKRDNIVLSKQGVAMLTDFGFSFLDSGSCSVLAMRDRLGALQWRAPEFIANLAERPTFASDIFSLGMCIIAAVNGAKYPWGNFDSAAVRKCYEERRIPVKRPHCMTEDQWELVGKMLRSNGRSDRSWTMYSSI